jgi:hypothetical protein
VPASRRCGTPAAREARYTHSLTHSLTHSRRTQKATNAMGGEDGQAP